MKEIEVKVLNVDLEKIKEKLKSLNAEKVKEENQKNYFFSLPNGENGYVRIRIIEDLIDRKEKITLCIKKIFKTDFARQNIEHEFEVSDFNECINFLNELGINDFKREDKHRESYILNGTLIEFDTWDKIVFPIPYMEIEAPSIEALEDILKILDIPKDKITSKGLLEIKRDMGLI
ncbi:class IV adenylate cyclase [Caloramator sp. ALD01]|uniref:class IV adenylate cyclase n=1 Tax=Caloramator sp. ALD01 TaxID=1031288 RepID=UPI0004073778|nr:class IV adenylate cyclase [Caloramator sp. ALD01]